MLIRHIFPFIAVVNHQVALKKALIGCKPLRRIARANNKALKKDLRKNDLESAIRDIPFSPVAIQVLTRALIDLNGQNAEMAAALKTIRQMGVYSGSQTVDDSTLVRKMVENLTTGLGYVSDDYYLGHKPQYGKIDGMSIDLKNPEVRSDISDSLLHWSKSFSSRLFYYLPLMSALNALRLNGRTEAIWYDPLTAGMNASPFAAVKKINFSTYKYSAILVPGLGPELPEVRLTEGGKARCRMAVQELNKGEAPFLIVSGGHVHPNKTPFCEAVEMKKYLVDSLNIDESIVMIEPYARHTTTNLRNAARLIKQMGMPFNMPVLVVTDESQSAYINKGMRKVSLRDLGYEPYTHLRVLSPTHTSFLPAVKSFIINPRDPLDP